MDVIDYIASREQMLTTAEVASLLNLDPSTIMRWINKGYLTACRFRNYHLFNPAVLADELRAAQRSTLAGTVGAGMQPDYVPVKQRPDIPERF
jgi:excisionase family DNA binding protein